MRSRKASKKDQKNPERIEIDNYRAAAIEKLKGKGEKETRKGLGRIYKHLPGDMVEYMTHIFFKYNQKR